jgi:hypothetical protein
MFTQLKNLLPREFKRHGLKAEVEALEVINLYKKIIEEIFGEKAQGKIDAKVYKNKMLYIDAVNSSWAQALFLKQHEILERLNQDKNALKVKKINIKATNE